MLTCSYHGIVVSRPALMPILDLDILLRRYPAQVGPHMHPFSYILLFSGIWLLFRVPTCPKQAILIQSFLLYTCVAQNIINNKQLNHNKITTSLSRQMRNKVHVLQVANILYICIDLGNYYTTNLHSFNSALFDGRILYSSDKLKLCKGHLTKKAVGCLSSTPTH